MKLKYYYLTLLFIILQIGTVWAQTREVSGVVTDANDVPLPGANILVQGTSTGTLTDFDGNYSIQAASGDVLVISYVGYESQEITLEDQTTVNASLNEDTNALDEVVVVGYGTQKKSVVTGAISSVKAEDIESLPINRVEQSLQGRASGLTIAANSGQPGSASTIRVRGITSFGNNEPLWVVDGVIVDAGGIGFLNQSDIKSIEVLKDAASQAIYGARAAAGVILVTTKKGEQGKLTVNYNGFMGLSGPARKLDLLNAREYATLSNEKYANDYSGSASNYNLPFDASSYGEGTDWQDLIFSNAAQRQIHELSLSGGNDISTFYLSFGYLDQEGIVTKDISHYTRKNIRINSTHKLNDFITVGQNLGYSNEKSIGLGNTNSEFGGPLSSAINLDPITPAVETDPMIANAPPYNRGSGIFRNAAGNPYGISNLVFQEITNPLAYTETRRNFQDWADNFVGNAYINLELLPGLNVKSTLGGKLAYYGSNNFTPVSYLNSNAIVSQNNISRNANRGFGWNIENTLSYSKTLGAHDFNVLVGQGTYVENDTQGETVTYNNIPITNPEDASFFEVPDDQIIASAYIGVEHRVTSLFTRLNYNYDEKYLLTGIIRRDGSSRFGANNKYGWFPSFSLGWVPTKENFWKENTIVNQLKIRGGYGVVGSDAIGDFRFLSTVSPGRNYTLGNVSAVVIGSSPNAPPNPDLRWEETRQTNIGFDSRLFNNFTLNFDYYNKKTVGILQDIFLPGYVGATGNPASNVADMVNRGFDLELGYNTTIGDLNISANANFSYLENEVTYLGDDIDFLSGGETIQSGNYPLTRTAVGQAVNSFYGFQTNGIFQTQADVTNYVNAEGTVIQPNAVPGDFRWQDTNGDGAITEADRTFLGNSIPKYSFGFTINMDYKNFDLLIFSQGAAGNEIFQGLRRLDITNANYQAEALGRWVGAGTSNDYPRLSNVDGNNNFSNPSDFYLEKGDYLRLKTLQLGYSLPQESIEQIGLSKLRIYLTGENLFTFTNYTGFDPEIGGGVFGIDRGYYPQAISGLLGFNLQF